MPKAKSRQPPATFLDQLEKVQIGAGPLQQIKERKGIVSPKLEGTEHQVEALDFEKRAGFPAGLGEVAVASVRLEAAYQVR